jgi:alkyl hydroperoxide reductase subunit AhpC
MLNINEEVPYFEGTAYTATGVKTVKSIDFKGKWLVLLFYVADFSAVCPTEIIEFNKEYGRFDSNNADILGISTDSVQDHEKLVNTNKDLSHLNFPLVSDSTGNIAKIFGIFDMVKKKIQRSTVIINPDGLIKYFLVTDNYLGRNTEETYRALKGLQSGKACPVNWKAGDS